ncbi:MAG: toll/interleukin-1 receptor domain-containing protein [Candidatus Gracilibacteria bacterium]|nr:toll/interleukin-1 receptor domain-containing protein [Candidatus Gracilibacteria bacterium]
MEHESSSSTFLDEKRWRSLTRDIHAGQVIPVIGPELVTIATEDGLQMPLYRHLAIELARELKVVLPPEQPPTLNAVACAWVLSGKSGKAMYDELRELVDSLETPPSQSLLDLASITDFSLFISSTFDPLMGLALQQTCPGFLPERNSLKFHPNNPQDLPLQMPAPFLYHILGTHNTYPDFVVWEEDYIEYVCGLLEKQDNLRVLFEQLRNKDLLLIGSPFNDWIVRFFLRIAKGKRLSEPRNQGRQDYVAQDPSGISHPTIFFFEQQVGSTRIIPGDPRSFAAELALQWRERRGSALKGDILSRMTEDMPRGAVFISYSRDDLDVAQELACSLMAAQIPVWLDKKRLDEGHNYERALEYAVKNDASFFISLISKATESDGNRFVHTERAWAAQRHIDGFVFYIPVLIDEIAEVMLEPPQVAKVHRVLLPGGKVTPDFIQRMQRRVAEHRDYGQPRD